MNDLNSFFWATYLHSIQIGTELECQEDRISSSHLSLSTKLADLSKGNINNAKILLLSCLREVLNDLSTPIYLALSLEGKALPIDCKSSTNFKSGAKDLLNIARDSLSHLTTLKHSNHKGILIGDQHTSSNFTIQYLINSEVNKIEVLSFPIFEKLAHALVNQALDLLDEKTTDNSSLALLIHDSVSTSLGFRNERRALLEATWSSVFDTKINWDQSFFSNGGDSIQAIRFISKIKSKGWSGDFGSLLKLAKLDQWVVTRSASHKSVFEDKSCYPLSFMQQKIWEQKLHFKGKGLYHEQFLFSLDQCPEVELVANAYAKVWDLFPQLRISIDLNGGIWMQTQQDFLPDFRVIEELISTDELLNNDINEGFSGPLMRCQLLKQENKTYLLWSHHHVILDGWSVGLLIKKFIGLLEGLDLEPQTLNPQQFLVELELNHDTKLVPDWKTFFSKYEAQHFNTSLSRTHQFAEKTTLINPIKIQGFCKEHSITPHQFYLSAFALVNFALTGKSDVYIHSISSGRSLFPEFAEEAIGLFIRNIVVGWQIDSDGTVKDLLKTLSKAQNQALEFEVHDPQGMLDFQNETPDTLFVFENYPYERIQGKEISGELVFNQEITGYPFTFLVMPGEQTMLKILFDTGRFSTEFIDGFVEKFISTIDWICCAPNEKLKSIPKPDAHSYAEDKSPLWVDVIDQNLFSDSIQIINSESKLRIGSKEIRLQVEKTAQYFKSCPAGTRIALYGQKDEHTPGLIFALMRCGLVYVPINPTWPKDRIQKVLELANCKLLIYPDQFLKNELNIEEIYVSEMSNVKIQDQAKLPVISKNQEAYILFTSGSSGEPKGVSLSHQNLSVFLFDCSILVNSDEYDHLFSLTNLGFDLSIFENIFGLYSNKTTVVIPNAEGLENAIVKFPHGLLNTVPSVLNKLEAEEIKCLNVVHTAGEPFSIQSWQRLKSHHAELIIKNWYGPTETTTYSSMVDLSVTYSEHVGSALLHETIQIWDHLNMTLAENMEGEITIGGYGVALGYINAENTAFEKQGEQRFYRTGDIGFIKNGHLYLKGRKDRQVKRLGQRFELSEVEQSLLHHFKGIKRVVYLNEKPHFSLFVETTLESQEEICDWMSQNFPLYMRPDRTICLSNFPENSNGKIDEMRLLSDHPIALQEKKQSTVDSFLMEKIKTLPWFEELSGEYGFIEQGGDSILGLRLVGKLKGWGYEAKIGELLSAPSLFEYLDTLPKKTFQNWTNTALPLTPIQAWFLSDYCGNRNHFNQSVLLEIQVEIETSQLVNMIQNTLHSFPILSQVFTENWQYCLAPNTIQIVCNHESELSEVCQNIQAGFDLEKGPVAGAAVLSLGQKNFVFIALHHFYCDGFSWRILLDELKSQLLGQKNIYSSHEVYGQVREALQHLAETDKPEKHYGDDIINPFGHLEPSCYKESHYETWRWNQKTTNAFMRQWLPNHSTNEKFVYLVLSVWMEANLPHTTVFLESHGRSYEGVDDLSESLGWFTQFYPILSKEFPEKSELLNRIEHEFAVLPSGGLTYMAMPKWTKPTFPLLLNFLGSFDENWGGMAIPSDLPTGSMVDENNPLLGHVEINALIVEGELQWMLRSHPEVDLKNFRNLFINWAQENIQDSHVNQISIDESIDTEDINAINDLLNGL